MRINSSQEAPPPPHTVDSQAIKDVNRFTYLAIIVRKTGRTDKDVKARINKVHQTFATLSQFRGVKTSAVARNRDCSTATSNQFFCTGQEPEDAPRNEITSCRSSSTSVSVRFYELDGQKGGEELGRSPSLKPSRTESGDRLDIPYAESRQVSPAKLKLTEQLEERKTMFDMEKDSTS